MKPMEPKRQVGSDRQWEVAHRADRVVDLDAGHHAFLSRPAEVRDFVLGLSR